MTRRQDKSVFLIFPSFQIQFRFVLSPLPLPRPLLDSSILLEVAVWTLFYSCIIHIWNQAFCAWLWVCFFFYQTKQNKNLLGTRAEELSSFFKIVKHKMIRSGENTVNTAVSTAIVSVCTHCSQQHLGAFSAQAQSATGPLRGARCSCCWGASSGTHQGPSSIHG